MTKSIDTFGWDTIFGISYDYLNKEFQKSNAKLPDFSDWADDDSGVAITGSWSYFQVTTGGSGQDLQMMCKLNSGTVEQDATTNADFTDAWLKIQVNLATTPNPDYPAKDTTGSGGTVSTLNVNATGTVASPAVSIISSQFPNVGKGLLKTALPVIFQRYFIANIAQFNQVFAAVDLNVIAEKGDYQWLKPSYTTYACADTGGDQGVFAVLSKTDNGDANGLTQQVDNRILQLLPDGSNSVLAISPKKVLEHIFLPGAVFALPGSKAEDFEITNNNLWIVNKKDISWGTFTLESGQVIAPKIKAHNFQLGLVGQTLQLQIIDAIAKWPDWKGPGEIHLHMNITQDFEFELKQKTNGEYVLVPKPETEGTSVKAITTRVTVSKGVTIFEVCLGIAISIFAAVLAGAGEVFNAAGSVAVEAAESAVIKITKEVIEEVFHEIGKETVKAIEKEAAESASNAVENSAESGYETKFENAITANKWKIFGGVMSGGLAVPVEMIPEFMRLVADDDLDTVPSFNNFAGNVTGTTTFPGSTGWDLKSAGLNGPLVITGALK